MYGAQVREEWTITQVSGSDDEFVYISPLGRRLRAMDARLCTPFDKNEETVFSRSLF